VDDLHGDEEEGAEPEDPPRDTEPPNNPVTERERDCDLEQGDDGERGDDQRSIRGRYITNYLIVARPQVNRMS